LDDAKWSDTQHFNNVNSVHKYSLQKLILDADRNRGLFRGGKAVVLSSPREHLPALCAAHPTCPGGQISRQIRKLE
jgi:hypothetical protein